MAVPFDWKKGVVSALSWFYVPLTLFILVGTSNAVNLTDGLDGLAIGPYIIAASCFALFIYVAGHATISEYLKVMPVPGVGEVTVFCGALIGASLGFLWFNAYPAEVVVVFPLVPVIAIIASCTKPKPNSSSEIILS